MKTIEFTFEIRYDYTQHLIVSRADADRVLFTLQAASAEDAARIWVEEMGRTPSVIITKAKEVTL